MPELEKISIKGFKSIADIDALTLGTVNILIGANGSGKSNFINVFSFLRDLKEGRLQDYVRRSGGANRVLHFGVKKTKKIEFFLKFDNEVNQYSIALESTENDELYPSKEVVYYWNKEKHAGPYSEIIPSNGSEAGISSPRVTRVASYVIDHFNRWRVYHFHDTSSSSPMKKPSKVADNKYLRADASNLAAFLYLLKMKYEDSYLLIKAAMKKVFPAFDDFLLSPDFLNVEFISLEWKNRYSDDYFDSSSFSDGTVRFLALATLLLQPPTLRPSIIIVDEPELGLHPSAITVLTALVKQAAVDTQVILSTQSPFLLDHFSPDQVIVANLENGATKLTRLDSEELNSWLDDYSLGQLWEKNEIGGRPIQRG